MPEILAVHALGISKAPGVQQRRTEPVARGEGQRLRIVDEKQILERPSTLEGRKCGRQISGCAIDFTLENRPERPEQRFRGMDFENGLRRRRDAQHAIEGALSALGVATAELRIPLGKVPDATWNVIRGTFADGGNLVESTEPYERQRVIHRISGE